MCRAWVQYEIVLDYFSKRVDVDDNSYYKISIYRGRIKHDIRDNTKS